MASPVEALQYIVDDLHLALNLVDKSADGLALLVSLLAQAAASELTGKPKCPVIVCSSFLSHAKGNGLC